MRAAMASLATMAVATVVAFFATERLCLAYEAYQHRLAQIQEEAYLRAQCHDPEFFKHLGRHTNLCDQLESTARMGAAWHAIHELSRSLPVAQVSAPPPAPRWALAPPLTGLWRAWQAWEGAQRVGWPVLAVAALAFLLCPSLIVSQWRGYRPEPLPMYQTNLKMA